MKDFQGNEVIKGDSVVFVKKPTGELKVGTISFIGKYGIQIISAPHTRYWRGSKEILKITPTVAQSVPEMKPNYLNKHPHISEKRIQHIIDAIPEVKWDPATVKMTILGWGDKPAFTMLGYIKKPINGKIVNVTWHSNTPGGGNSKIYFQRKNRKRVVQSTLRAGTEAISKIIEIIKN